MRGTPFRRHGEFRRTGIIPAYAGNTISRSDSRASNWDHPRVCGEHSNSRFWPIFKPGSSPRMRGTRQVGWDEAKSPGIIPAYAGNTRFHRLAGNTPRDHSRVCGEHTTLGTDRHIPKGSSPRMRGTLCFFQALMRYQGIIPAYAGNTWASAHTTRPARDHPRVCGEHRNVSVGNASMRGSSPRMRGTPIEPKIPAL